MDNNTLLKSEVESPVYKFTVDLNVLDHLGINLYSNISAVLTEIVANAWDADAHEVRIAVHVNTENEYIEIQDDGIGMTVRDMNEKYLRVGYKRRHAGEDTSPSGRKVMGRKGLGKLSLFSIANTIEIQSSKEGQKHGLTMKVEDIRKSVEESKQDYTPVPLNPEKVTVEKGTLIRLTEINRSRISRSIDSLRILLARRFSVIGAKHNFNVYINDQPITIEDREELRCAECIWFFGDCDKDTLPTSSTQIQTYYLPSRNENWPDNMKVSGWIASTRYPKDLEKNEYNLNSVLVIARGRLIQENILDRLNDGRLFTKYITGQIEADFLDQSDSDDIATSDRQRIQEDDPRFHNLLGFLKKQMSTVASQWDKFRKKNELIIAKENNPALEQWLNDLPGGFRNSAETLLSNIAKIHVENDDDRKELYKCAILAFERMKLRGSTELLSNNVNNSEILLQLLADRDSLEASLYHDIVKSRLEAVQSLCTIVDDNEKEKVLQKYLFDHLWLLDSSWERATGSERIEQAFTKEFTVSSANLTEDERKGRVDIRYKTSAGKHIIVELKRVNRVLSVTELQEQGQKYKSALYKCLTQEGVNRIDIEIVFVLGKPVVEANNRAFGPTYVPDILKALNARIVYYDEMIANANKSYSEYLEASKNLQKLDTILDSL